MLYTCGRLRPLAYRYTLSRFPISVLSIVLIPRSARKCNQYQSGADSLASAQSIQEDEDPTERQGMYAAKPSVYHRYALSKF